MCIDRDESSFEGGWTLADFFKPILIALLFGDLDACASLHDEVVGGPLCETLLLAV